MKIRAAIRDVQNWQRDMSLQNASTRNRDLVIRADVDYLNYAVASRLRFCPACLLLVKRKLSPSRQVLSQFVHEPKFRANRVHFGGTTEVEMHFIIHSH